MTFKNKISNRAFKKLAPLSLAAAAMFSGLASANIITAVAPAAGGTFGSTGTVVINVTFDEDIIISAGATATLPIVLDSGSVNATLTSTGTANPLQFSYTIGGANTDTDTDGVAIAGPIVLGSGTLTGNTSTNAAVLTFGGVTPTGLAAVLVDTTAPTITSVTYPAAIGVPSGGIYGAGETITALVTFDEEIAVAVNPVLQLQIGANARTMTLGAFTPGDTTLTYTYDVVVGEEVDTDIGVVNPGALTLTNPDDVTDVVDVGTANNLNATSADLSATIGLSVDGVAPVLSNAVVVPTPGTITTPVFGFDTDETGTASIAGGSCAGAVQITAGTSAVTAGASTVTLEANGGGPLGPATFTGCEVTVTDAAGNASAIIAVADFEITAPPAPAPAASTPVPLNYPWVMLLTLAGLGFVVRKRFPKAK